MRLAPQTVFSKNTQIFEFGKTLRAKSPIKISKHKKILKHHDTLSGQLISKNICIQRKENQKILSHFVTKLAHTLSKPKNFFNGWQQVCHASQNPSLITKKDTIFCEIIFFKTIISKFENGTIWKKRCFACNKRSWCDESLFHESDGQIPVSTRNRT